MLRYLSLLPVAAALVVAAPGTAFAEPNCFTVGSTVVFCDEEDLGKLSRPNPTTVKLTGARVSFCYYLTAPGGICVDQSVDVGETGVIRPSATVDPSGTTPVPPVCYRGHCTPAFDVPLAVDVQAGYCPNGDHLLAYVVVHDIGVCVGLSPAD